MQAEIIQKYDRAVPRYTSYPTAPHFNSDIGPGSYRHWLRAAPVDRPLSLYLHIPFCDSMCWFCGCHTKVVRRYAPVAAYLSALEGEIELVAEVFGGPRRVRHLHFGGGSPTILHPEDVTRLARLLRRRFSFRPDLEFAVEIDPRDADLDVVKAWAAAGATRASLGLQDVNPKVQRAINRIQPIEQTARVAEWLRGEGIEGLNLDLMYGLPHQTLRDVDTTVEAALALRPDRIALFGYAHVPWMKKHQQLISQAALPGTQERYYQSESAARVIRAAGYVRIGLDHFARPDDNLALALASGRLNRNFQGYTSDSARTLLGFGASAIGSLRQGYVQNLVPINTYKQTIAEGRLATARGVATGREDRLRRAVIERLMCDLRVDLVELCERFAVAPSHFDSELDRMREMTADGLVRCHDRVVEVEEAARPLLRSVCEVFDSYRGVSMARHSRAV